MNTNDAETVLLAVSDDDRTVHVGSAGAMAAHLTTEGGLAQSAVSFEFFGPDGQPWSPGKVNGAFALQPTPGAPPTDPQLLLDRIDAALAHMQVYLDRHPELGAGSGQVAGESRFVAQRSGQLLLAARVPRPTGTLPQVLAALQAEYDFLAPSPTRGNWLHNLAHAAGLAH